MVVEVVMLMVVLAIMVVDAEVIAVIVEVVVVSIMVVDAEVIAMIKEMVVVAVMVMEAVVAVAALRSRCDRGQKGGGAVQAVVVVTFDHHVRRSQWTHDYSTNKILYKM